MKTIFFRFMFFITILSLVGSACTRQPQPARVEEITFQSGEFKLVGELRTPAGTDPFPVILFVYGDTPRAAHHPWSSQ